MNQSCCELCHKDEAIGVGAGAGAGAGVLCQACAESIGRLMSIKQWLAALPMDKARNEEQVRLLITFAMPVGAVGGQAYARKAA